MPVERYRDVSEMPPPPRPHAGDLARRIHEVMARAARLAGPGYPPGVWRFRTLEEAQEAREAVLRARVERARAGGRPDGERRG